MNGRDVTRSVPLSSKFVASVVRATHDDKVTNFQLRRLDVSRGVVFFYSFSVSIRQVGCNFLMHRFKGSLKDIYIEELLGACTS